MAITKRFNVSFDVTAVLHTEDQNEMERDLIALCKAVGSGKIEPTPVQKEVIVQLLTHGMEGAMSFVVREALRKTVKEACLNEFDEEDFKFSPATVTEVR
ncbi:supressor of silencing [Escherichia phage vB_Ec_Tarrare]|uniref:Supressor of silencing n=1 Tax=Escherichia phage vB_Ec_Tarrare TaxID=3032379 RepID=A0AAF0IEJ1_9CAUD|nr:supressor of silencing [Escherichia phage vB_Ec_Tarrare]